MIPVGIMQQTEEFQIVIDNRAVCQRACRVPELVRREQVASEFPAEFDIDLRTDTGVFDEKPEMVVAAFPQAAVVFAYYLPEVFQKIPVAACGIEKAVLLMAGKRVEAIKRALRYISSLCDFSCCERGRA